MIVIAIGEHQFESTSTEGNSNSNSHSLGLGETVAVVELFTTMIQIQENVTISGVAMKRGKASASPTGTIIYLQFVLYHILSLSAVAAFNLQSSLSLSVTVTVSVLRKSTDL